MRLIRLAEGQHRAPGREEPAGGILGIDAGLDRMADQLDVVLDKPQWFAGSYPDLLLDQIQTGAAPSCAPAAQRYDQLGDRVLDLQPGVHLHEEELRRPVGRDDELHGPGTGVPDRPGGLDCRVPHPVPGGHIEQDRRSLLDDLLVPTLQTAFAFAQMDDCSVLVGKQLDLDVPRALDEPLDQQGVVAKGVTRFPPGTRDRLGQRGLVGHLPHALAAAAGRRFEQDRVADLPRRSYEVGVGESGCVPTGYDGDPCRLHGLLGPDLVAHRLDSGCRRADEHQPGVGAGADEVGVLGQESIAGMDRQRAAGRRRLDHPWDREVALGRRGWSDAYGDVGVADVPGVPVRVGVDPD